jgi:hypothetical protein
MAVTVTNSTQYAKTYGSTGVPGGMNAYRDDRASIRFLQFDCVQGVAAGDATSQFILGVVPAYAKILPTSTAYFTGMATTNTVKIGYLAFDTLYQNQVTTVAASLDCLYAATATGAATGTITLNNNKVPLSLAALVNDGLFNGTGIILAATFAGTPGSGALPAAATLTGMIQFVAND